MRYPEGHKKKTSEKILRAAGRLFRKHGYSATGVDAVMSSAKLTAGAFYSHFGSKEDLLAATLDRIFQQAGKDRPKELGELRGHAWLRGFASFYLSPRHRDSPGRGCPMASLAAEVARLGGKPRAVFEQHLRRVLDAISQQFDNEHPDRERSINMLAQCLGGLLLARAVHDDHLSEEILVASRKLVMREIGGP